MLHSRPVNVRKLCASLDPEKISKFISFDSTTILLGSDYNNGYVAVTITWMKFLINTHIYTLNY